MLTDAVAGWQISLEELLWHKADYAQQPRHSPIAAATFGFALGCLLLALPWNSQQLGYITWLAAAGLLACAWLRRFALPAALRWLVPGLLLGLLLAGLQMKAAVQARVPLCADQFYRELRIRIDSQPSLSAAQADQQRVASFSASLLDPVEAADCRIAAGSRLRLSWFDPPALQRGDVWEVQARVRPPWSYQNPGGFDYERWLFSNRFDGSGYVRSGATIHAPRVAAESFASWLAASDARNVALVMALVRGDASGLSDTQWRWFRDSGTVHLMVVSGLHVGLVVGVSYFVFSLLLRVVASRFQLDMALPAGLLALAVAAGFVASSGSGIPAQRAWLMAAVLLWSTALGWRLSRLFGFLLSVAVVLAVDPLAAHANGFYLSFGAVAVLLGYFSSRTFPRSPLPALIIVQVVLYLFMTPLLALQQPTLPLSGTVINLLAVPALGVILPLLLLVAGSWWLLPAFATWLLGLADLLLGWLLQGVEWSAGGGTVLAGGGLPVNSLLSVGAAVFLCSRLPWTWRGLLLPCWLAWLIPASAAVPPGEFRVIALDVGQGSALLIDTARHRLLFDTGPGFPGGFNLGAAAVLPSLLRTGPAYLDAVVLSHQDLDHTGGMLALQEHLRISAIYSSFPWVPPAVYRQREPQLLSCQREISWHWDGVEFRFLTPPASPGSSDNDRSCVLRVDNAAQSALFSGDISRRTERRLARDGKIELSATVASAPHHGSNGSSSPSWIAAVKPHQVLISAPRRSRYGHPHADVVQRYQAAGAEVAVTGLSGAQVWRSWQPQRVIGWRRQNRAYWINREPHPDARVHPGE